MNMGIRVVFFITLCEIVCTANTCAAQQDVETLPLFQQAKKANPKRHQFAVDQHATFHLTPDGKSFYVRWLPPKADERKTVPLVVTLHGHASWAIDEFALWHAALAKRGYGIIALQWWFGQGEKPNDYYRPKELYDIVATVLRERKAVPGSVLLHGFSRGSANIYGVTAFDRASNDRFVLLTVANAGRAAPDFPVNRDIDAGRFGEKPFEGTHWVLYAGALDENPDRDGIPGMRQSRDWVVKHGGIVERLIEDPKGDHGGFHRNPENMNAALDIFARLLAARK